MATKSIFCVFKIWKTKEGGKAEALVKPSAHNRVIFNKDEWIEENISGSRDTFLEPKSALHRKYLLN